MVSSSQAYLALVCGSAAKVPRKTAIVPSPKPYVGDLELLVGNRDEVVRCQSLDVDLRLVHLFSRLHPRCLAGSAPCLFSGRAQDVSAVGCLRPDRHELTTKSVHYGTNATRRE